MKLVLDPEAIVARAQGQDGWLREARHQLDEHRRLRADPIAGSRSERLLEAERRLRENLLVECEANEAYEHLTVTDGIHCWSFCLTKAGASLGHNKAPARDDTRLSATTPSGLSLWSGLDRALAETCARRPVERPAGRRFTAECGLRVLRKAEACAPGG